MRATFRQTLLAGVAFCVALPAHAATVVPTPPVPAASDASVPAAAAPVQAGSGPDAQTTTSANSAGQANDKQSLTSADIIVTGSKTAQSAPITVSLTTTQPQSAVSRDYIANTTASADFNELIALTPSVSISGAGNGYGLGETKATIRGFQDGEYNVTYDSIPFADTNNPTHHSTSFFPSNTIETIVVDRGPGNASQLGQATYGGNINMYSRAATEQRGAQVEGIVGNWNTFIGRAEVQSGSIEKLGGARIVLTGQYLQSDGALTYSPVGSKNLYGKIVAPIGSHNTLTIMSTWNRNHYYQSDVLKGATCGSAAIGANKTTALGTDGLPLTQLTGENCSVASNVGQYGRTYGLSNTPSQQDYWKYNRTDKTTDFSYVRLQTDLGSGFSLDNRGYMYGYTNNTLSGNTGSVITGFSGAGTAASPYKAVAGPTSDILGYSKLNKYRVFGYIGQVNYDFALGKIRVGGWYEHAVTDRHLVDLDRTTNTFSFNEKFNNGNGTAAQNALPPITQADLSYVQHSNWNQYQLFGEFEFHPVAGLSITPGVKYVHFERGVAAPVNQKTRLPLDTSQTWTKTLPFATINYMPTSNWSFYGQYAQGMYVPDLSSFYSASGTLSTALDALKPQTSTNYQVGTVWHGNKVSVDVDGYIINIDNKIGTCTTTGCDQTLLVNIGQVRYKGVEGALSYMPVRGLTLFGNGSYNYAHNVMTGAQIAKAPFTTAAGGFIYRRQGFRLSFDQRFTGPQYANEYTGSPDYRLYRIRPYSIGEFAISQEIQGGLRLGVTVNNVFNSRAVTAISTSATGAPVTAGYQNGYGQLDQFNYLPPRSFLLSARIGF
ncbi:TonB-dependent receptor [Sphingomonas sp. PAMC 26617]|uniref:TonB-dependent receptor n=1 Tax=Sphingomonas sp. PAMC 26617 TaxID=1112216 RepID=UPI00030F396D|nr:TonB-dependent receptor [Sphingomonas sp. PAMC 26617]